MDFFTGREALSLVDLQLKELRPAALTLKVKLEKIETQTDANGLDSAFQTAKNKQVNAIMTTAARPVFYLKKRNRRTRQQGQVAGYLLSEGVCL